MKNHKSTFRLHALFFLFGSLLFVGNLKGQDQLIAARAEVSVLQASGLSGNYLDAITVTLTGVAANSSVMVVASYEITNGKSASDRDALLYLTDDVTDSPVIKRTLTTAGSRDDNGIGTLVWIFDYATAGDVTFKLKHASSTANGVNTLGTLVAIHLKTSTSSILLDNSHKSISDAVTTTSASPQGITALETDAITLDGPGSIYISSSINTSATTVTTSPLLGEWEIQHKTDDTDWTAMGNKTTRSLTSTGKFGIASNVWLASGLEGGNHYFRMAQRVAGGSGTISTSSTSLVAVALNYTDVSNNYRSFPAFMVYNSSTVSTTPPSVSYTNVISASGYPKNDNTDVFFHAKYNIQATDLSLPNYQIYVDNGAYSSQPLSRNISDSTDTGSGGSVGLAQGLSLSTNYTMALQHKSDESTVTLNTSNIVLAGFELKDVISSISWDGSTDNDRGTADNWSGGAVPNSDDVVNIFTGDPVISSSTSADCVNLYVDGSASLTINSTSESANGSLIVSGTSTGNVTYNRWMTADKWHIVSAPVEGQDSSTFLANVDNAISYIDPNYAVTHYVESSNEWGSYYKGGTSGAFESGVGYLMRRQSTPGTVSFTGTVADTDFGVTLSKTVYGWNALGNPFTSAINANSTADAANNLITVNVNNSAIDPSFAALYVWDEQASYTNERNDYKVINHVAVPGGESTLTGQNHIQAGLGFIVKAKTNAATFSFTRAMQTHQTTTPFKSAEISEWADINIIVSYSESSTKTGLKFSDQMTNGLDIGYDAGILKGNPDFCLYTQLAEDNGVEFMLQCLPLQNLEMMEISIGLDATIGGEITLSIQKENFPASLIPVLNDKLLNTQFAFNSESDVYATTIKDNTKGFGRFTLTFSSNTDVEDLMLGQAHFKAWCSNDLLNISGEIIGEGQATVYDINGHKLAAHRLIESGRTRYKYQHPLQVFIL